MATQNQKLDLYSATRDGLTTIAAKLEDFADNEPSEPTPTADALFARSAANQLKSLIGDFGIRAKRQEPAEAKQ